MASSPDDIRSSELERKKEQLLNWLSTNNVHSAQTISALAVDIAKHLDGRRLTVPMPEGYAYDDREPDENRLMAMFAEEEEQPNYIRETEPKCIREPEPKSFRCDSGHSETGTGGCHRPSIVSLDQMLRQEERQREKERKEQLKALKTDLRQRIDELKRLGADADSIRVLVDELLKPQCTPLHVSTDYRLTIPALSRNEISLYPADKALYLTFLCYPEGIYFSELIDYREELMDFYLKVSLRRNADAANEVIGRLVEQGGNGINISVSRINKAFTKACGSLLSPNYCILGKKGDKKKVALPEGMVVWEGN